MQLQFPSAPAKAFLVGLGGIGMSALAQYLAHRGYQVSGSDRDLTTPSQQRLFISLAQQGIAVYQQDGSGPEEEKPDFIVYSSAIEEDNPDFVAAGDCPRFHRSETLSALLQSDSAKAISVAGSSGKTSTTEPAGGIYGRPLRRLRRSRDSTRTKSSDTSKGLER